MSSSFVRLEVCCMQFVDDKVCLVNVDVDYLHELHKASSEVPFAEGYKNKPFVGILILNADIKYVVPLSSAKEKHKGWKNESQDYFIIYEIAKKQAMYRDVDPSFLPQNESLETTIERVVPYFLEEIKPQMKAGKRVIIAAHGNSLRALVKYLDNLSPEEILEVNIPTGTPLVYEFDDNFKVIKHYYLGDQEAIAAKMNAVANQGKKK